MEFLGLGIEMQLIIQSTLKTKDWCFVVIRCNSLGCRKNLVPQCKHILQGQMKETVCDNR